MRPEKHYTPSEKRVRPTSTMIRVWDYHKCGHSDAVIARWLNISEMDVRSIVMDMAEHTQAKKKGLA